jgi:hypothetical protein
MRIHPPMNMTEEHIPLDERWQNEMKKIEPELISLDGPLKMANLFAQTMANAKNAGISTRIPIAAEEWAEMVFNEWFEVVGKIAKSYGLRRKLLDRELFDPRAIDAFSWQEGIEFEDVDVLSRTDENAMYELNPEEINDLIEESFGPYGDDPAMNGMFDQKFKSNLLSGQYNRLFPLKIVLRTAASLILARDEYHVDGEGAEIEYDTLHIEDLRSECLKVAKYAKEQLKWLDKRHSISIGEKISIGFPDRTGEKSKKQSERFASQFVGSVRTLGKGLPFEIGFLAIDKEGMVSFTELGVNFMLEKNPLIDLAEGFKEGKSFTLNEKKLLLRAIMRNTPKEFEYMINLIQWINEGHSRPNSLEEMIISEYDVDHTSASLMRTGALARMIELNLISRKQEGREVTFLVTDLGQNLMQKK